jgi:hypothetical protein
MLLAEIGKSSEVLVIIGTMWCAVVMCYNLCLHARSGDSFLLQCLNERGDLK